MMTNHKKLNYIIFFIVCALPPIIYSFRGGTDQFSFEHIAYTRFYLNSAHFPSESSVFSPKYIPGAMSYYLVFCKITGIPPETFQYLPIVGLILPLAYYALCKCFTNNKKLSMLITSCMMYTIVPSDFFTIWVHAWGFLLVIILSLLFYRVFEKKTPEFILLLLIVFISIHFYSYTSEMWSVFILLTFNTILFFSIFLTKNEQIKKKLTYNLTMAFIAIALFFNKIIYDVFLPKGGFSNTLIYSANVFVSIVLHKYLEGVDDYAYIGESHLLVSIFGILYYSILLLVILTPILCYAVKFVRTKKLNSLQDLFIIDKNTYFKYTFLIFGVLDILIYSLAGVFTTRAILFIYPIVVLISLKQSNIKVVYVNIIVSVLFIVALSHYGFDLYYDSNASDYSHAKYMEPSAGWFLSNSATNHALTDLVTGNKYLLYDASKQIIFKKSLIGLDEYKLIVAPESNVTSKKLKDFSSYVIVNTKETSIKSMKWGYYNPFSKYINSINNNKHMNKIYGDKYIFIYHTI